MAALVPAAFIAFRRAFVSVVFVLWLLVPCLVYADQFTGKVVGISDGDTIRVLRAGKAVKVRLYGIDTPEKAQAFGTQARKFTSDFAFQRDVTVEIRATDRYGRLVGEVLLPDGRSLNQELVRAGLAWWYRPYAPNDPRSRNSKPRPGPPSAGCGLMRTLCRPGSGGRGNVSLPVLLCQQCQPLPPRVAQSSAIRRAGSTIGPVVHIMVRCLRSTA